MIHEGLIQGVELALDYGLNIEDTHLIEYNKIIQRREIDEKQKDKTGEESRIE